MKLFLVHIDVVCGEWTGNYVLTETEEVLERILTELRNGLPHDARVRHKVTIPIETGQCFILPGTSEREAIVTDELVLYVRDPDPDGGEHYRARLQLGVVHTLYESEMDYVRSSIFS